MDCGTFSQKTDEFRPRCVPAELAQLCLAFEGPTDALASCYCSCVIFHRTKYRLSSRESQEKPAGQRGAEPTGMQRVVLSVTSQFLFHKVKSSLLLCQIVPKMFREAADVTPFQIEAD